MQPNTSFLGREQLNQTKPLPHPRASQHHTALLQGQAAHTELQEHRALLAVGLPAVQHDTTCNFFFHFTKIKSQPRGAANSRPRCASTAAPSVGKLSGPTQCLCSRPLIAALFTAQTALLSLPARQLRLLLLWVAGKEAKFISGRWPPNSIWKINTTIHGAATQNSFPKY